MLQIREVPVVTMTYPQALRHECCVNGFTIRLSGSQQLIMQTLLIRGIRITTVEILIDVLYPNPDVSPEAEKITVLSLMHQLRKKLPKGTVVNIHGFGWRLAQFERIIHESLATF